MSPARILKAVFEAVLKAFLYVITTAALTKEETVYSESFAKALGELMGFEVGPEGSYGDHPSDRGGKTNWGITEAAARRNGYEGDMRELPFEVARRIYHEDYWACDRVRLDLLTGVAGHSIASEVFEQGVNTGVVRTAKRVQRVLNVLNRGERLYKDLKVDGWLGDATQEAVEALRKAGDLDDLFRWLNIAQGAHYLAVIENDPTQEQEDFARGWARRVEMEYEEDQHD